MLHVSDEVKTLHLLKGGMSLVEVGRHYGKSIRHPQHSTESYTSWAFATPSNGSPLRTIFTCRYQESSEL
jgi:hypothetical protein